MISITLDLEWAPTAILEDSLGLLEQYNIDATLFSTHDDSLNYPNHERAIHPNFDTESSVEETLDSICTLYPDAIGLRSHQMYIHTRLRNEYARRGIKYESNYMAYKVEQLHPFAMPEGTVQFPVYWMDDIWFRQDGQTPNIEDLLEAPGLKVFDFHPPHITFNTPSAEFYAKHKKLYWDEDSNINKIRYEGYGVRDIFIDIISYIGTNNLDTCTLGELYEEHDNTN